MTQKRGPLIADIPLEYIRRPLLRTRNNDPEKVKQLMESIAEIGLQEPVSIFSPPLLCNVMSSFVLSFVTTLGLFKWEVYCSFQLQIQYNIEKNSKPVEAGKNRVFVRP